MRLNMLTIFKTLHCPSNSLQTLNNLSDEQLCLYANTYQSQQFFKHYLLIINTTIIVPNRRCWNLHHITLRKDKQ